MRRLVKFSLFVIVDLTKPRHIPDELAKIASDITVPIQPIIRKGKDAKDILKDLYDHPMMLPAYEYSDQETLLADFDAKVIQPAIDKVNEMKGDGSS